ncbi:IPT/TIG domain-containing protein [Flavobacterium sp. 5]|uniref:IPT/TIG domain-containing protein n=1 Tax=Flavobacterium sp. 5 TaxID=2035199 RepID=UPI000C2BB1D1|nr:IPT/TIG domain-containing protein [Flavobacterium sp. 5]PKB17822.1 IPT/TIG domain-containing protein [Flavobacterium sp. 5]
MKNFKKFMILKVYLIASISLFLLNSCSNDDNNGHSTTLAISGFSASVVDDPLIEGDRQTDVPVDKLVCGNMYIIRGTGFSSLKEISFNGMKSVFNLTLVTDTAIIVTIDSKTPYYNEMNEVKLVTGIGTLKYTIPVLPPYPHIQGFPINAKPGDLITITGDYFLHPVVYFGTTAVETVSSTLTEIVVKVPNGNYLQNLAITNVSGTTVAPQTFGSAIYDDAYTNIYGWEELWSDNNVVNKEYTKDFSQGSKCIEWKTVGDWRGYNIALASWNFTDTDKYKAVRFSIKMAKTGKVKFFVNGNADNNIKITEYKEGNWIYVEIPLSEVGSPAVLEKIGFQELGGFGGNIIYLDDIGLVLKDK